MYVFAVGEFVFILISAGDVKKSVGGQAALVSGAYSREPVPGILQHDFRVQLRLVVIPHHHMRSIGQDFPLFAFLPGQRLVDFHMHVFDAFADRPVPVSPERGIHRNRG